MALRPFCITAGLLVCAQAQNWTTISPTDPAFEWIGRTVVVPDPIGAGFDAVKYDVPGVEVRFRVQGATAVSVLMQQNWAPSAPYEPSGCCCTQEVWNNFIVFVDDVPRVAPDFPPGSGSTCLHCTFDTGAYYHSQNPEIYDMVRDLDPSVPHDIRLYKDSEADFNHCEPWPNWVMVHEFNVDAGEVVATPPPPVAPKKIEIIGGSTTCGYCNLCEWEGFDQGQSTAGLLRGSSCDQAWAGIMCKAMKADCHITAWSGMGVSVSLNKRALIHVPQVFPQAVQSRPGYKDNVWDFASWKPDAVIIDLGSNDRAAWSRPIFQEKYKEFVHDITKWYGRDISILAGCGMTDKSYCHQIKDMVAYFQKEGLKVSYLDLQTGIMTDRDMNQRTCCGHPNPEDHGIIAAWVQNQTERALKFGPAPAPDDNGPGRAGLSTPAVIVVICVCVVVLLVLGVVLCKMLSRKKTAPQERLVDGSVQMNS